MHIGLHREARRRQDAGAGDHIGALEADALGQHQPALDAALVASLSLGPAVVVLDALAPLAAQRQVIPSRQDGGTLQRAVARVAVAVTHPALPLPVARLARATP